jgi:hypothetical protein
MVNLKTLETQPFNPQFMATIQIPIPLLYDNNKIILVEDTSSSDISNFFEMVADPISCPCPGIMNFMNEVVSAPEDVQTILDFIAYCLWRAFPFHNYLLFNGTGRNGKVLCST